MKRYLFVENEASLQILQAETTDELYAINSFGKVFKFDKQTGTIIHVTRQAFKADFNFTDDMLMQVIRSRGKLQIASAGAAVTVGPTVEVNADVCAEAGEVSKTIDANVPVSEPLPIRLGKEVTDVTEVNVKVTEDTVEANTESKDFTDMHSTTAGRPASFATVSTESAAVPAEAISKQEIQKQQANIGFKELVRSFMKKPFVLKDELDASIKAAIDEKQFLTEQQVRDIIKSELLEFLKILRGTK